MTKNELYPLIGKCDSGKEEIIKKLGRSIKKRNKRYSIDCSKNSS